MARYSGPKNKLQRKIGADLGLRTNPIKVAKRLNVLPGQHGRRGRRKLSEYALQLLEKQKARITYGVLEKQFRRYFDRATINPKATGAALLIQLERRLDNVVYRSGLAPTRAAARQIINHGNTNVNGKKVTIPSYQVVPGETVSLSSTAIKIPYISEHLKNSAQGIPGWIKRKGAVSLVDRLPEREDITEDINEQLIVEFYSR